MSKPHEIFDDLTYPLDEDVETLDGTWRVCSWCGERFELWAQSDEDDRRFCDKECWQASAGLL